MISRREWITLSAGALFARPAFPAAAPTAPVSVARCRSYGAELVPTMDKMFDQLGGLGRLVAGKTVAMKVKVLAGGPTQRLGHLLPSRRIGLIRK